MEIRYHLDENVEVAVAVGLRQRRVNVSVSREEGLLGVDDVSQLAFARDASRVLMTHDRDFLRLAAAGNEHAGIAYCPPQTLTLGELIRRLVVLWRESDPASMVNRVVYL